MFKEHQRHPDCPDPERWHTQDREATEYEVGRFLSSLVENLKLDHVLEVGAYKGYTTEMLGAGVALAGDGHVDAIEIDPLYASEAKERCEYLPVTVHCMDSRDFVPTHKYDFMFFDSGMDSRIEEMKRFREYASERCVFAIHDSRGHWIQQALGHLNADYVNLPTPRGITIGRYK